MPYYKKLTTDEKHFIVGITWFDMRFNPLNKSNDSLDWNILFDDFNYMYKEYFNWASSKNCHELVRVDKKQRITQLFQIFSRDQFTFKFESIYMVFY